MLIPVSFNVHKKILKAVEKWSNFYFLMFITECLIKKDYCGIT